MLSPFGPGPGGPPPSIALPSGPGGAVGDPSGGGGKPGAPDSQSVTDKINQAADILSQALAQEKDPEDKALISEIVAKLHKFAGSQQSLVDKATGAGPGAKLVRKATPSY